MSDLENEKNDFWDIDKLIPPKKIKQPTHPQTVIARGFKLSDSEKNKDNDNCQLTVSKRTFTTETYIPVFNPFIYQVSIDRFDNPFEFYDSFRKAALLFYEVKGEVSPFEPFYSYMPQYTQLTAAQRAYYFYFRDEIRHGVYPKADCSYIYLYVFEILNLPEKIPPQEGIIRLCRLWAAYRKELPAIDRFMSVWIQDYCLLYKLSPPFEEMKDFLYNVFEKSTFREFYFSLADMKEKDAFSAVLRAFSDYDWRCGKYAVGSEKETYEKYFRIALVPVLRDIMAKGVQSSEKRSVITRDAFPYSICTQKVKARLRIEYCPLTTDMKIRDTVTAAVKYTENCMRSALGVRSRLAVKDLPEEYRRTIDAFFADILREAKRKKEEMNKPEYEKKYDSLSRGFSSSGADEIERESWRTTLRLVDEETKKELTATKESPKTEEKNQDCTGAFGLLSEDIAFLAKCMDSPIKSGMTIDAKAEKINIAFSENFGDVVLENDGTSWHLIDDYREDVREWLTHLPR